MFDIKAIYYSASSMIASNYDTLSAYAPSLALGFLSGFNASQVSHKKRFAKFSDVLPGLKSDTSFNVMNFVAKDWLGSRSTFLSSHLGMTFYWAGGLANAETRTFFIADALYDSVYATPYNFVSSDNTIIPFFYPSFETAGRGVIVNKMSLEDREKEEKNQWIDRYYLPLLNAYILGKTPAIAPIEKRKYCLKAPQKPLLYMLTNPFTGEESYGQDQNILGLLAYATNFFIGDIFSYQKNAKTLSLETTNLIEKYQVHRIEYEKGQKPTIQITLPNDVCSNAQKDQWKKDSTALIAQLASSNADIVFMQEWANADVHTAAADLINGLKEKGDNHSIQYYDINPTVAISDELYKALSLSAGSSLEEPPLQNIYTVGMENPNEYNKLAHHIAIPQHEINLSRFLGTAVAMATKELSDDILLFSLQKIYTDGNIKAFFEWKILWEGLTSMPRILLKVSAAPVKLAFYLGSMAYLYLSKKNKSVFEVPSASTTQTNMPKRVPSEAVVLTQALPKLENHKNLKKKLKP